MKLHPDHHDDLNAITAYGTGWVEVNGARHEGPLLLRPQGPLQPWSIDGLAALTPETLLALAEPRPEVILLGTGARLQFPPPSFSRPLLQAGIGLETMDSVAACRTYNILMAEGRRSCSPGGCALIVGTRPACGPSNS
ncbi:Mth938-like domain-containing protein [Lautropia mirabilis]